MPWYMDPTTACVDCQRNKGTGADLKRFHPGHQRIIGEDPTQGLGPCHEWDFPILGRGPGTGVLQ